MRVLLVEGLVVLAVWLVVGLLVAQVMRPVWRRYR